MRATRLAGIGAAFGALGLYLARRLVARALSLPPARYAVTVERDLAITMPDGVALHADHYAPRTAGRFPAILIRTPYGRGREAGAPLGLLSIVLCRAMAARGYHVVVQTVRGRFDSGGSFEPSVHEADDGRDTLEWIARQPWYSGAIGMAGESYLGYAQWAAAVAAPTLVRALVPRATTAHFYAAVHLDGAFALDLALRWINVLGALERAARYPLRARLRGLDPTVAELRLAPGFAHLPLRTADVAVAGRVVPFYRDWLDHPDATDAYWQQVDHREEAARVPAAAHLIGGWYDLFLRETIADYAALCAAGRAPYLTIGPWAHTDVGAILAGLRETLAWCDAHLKGEPIRKRPQPVRVFVMGAGEWRDLESWPPPTRPTAYYLQPGAALRPEHPPDEAPPDRYRYDPADPTPVMGGPLLLTGGPRDNRPLEARPDVLCYTTPPLEADVEILGAPRLEIYLLSSQGYMDLVGRLCDVGPDGRSINICDGLRRLMPGDGETQADGCRRVAVELWPTAHRFKRGHRLRLHVASGGHPRWSRNPGTGEPLATATTLVAVDHTVYHDRARASALILPLKA
jgi:putative CocE/NonD family hydrolase